MTTKVNLSLNIFLVAILILAFVIRALNIQNNPPGFFADEASNGYNAYSILKTGKDEWDVSYPLLFKAFGEYKNPVFIYSSLPFIALFGLNEFSVRFTSVFYGILAIFALYFLAKEMFNKRVALLSSFFLAISPWHIHFSRIGFQLISSVFWVILSLYLFVKSLKNFNFYPLVVISLMIAFFTYNTPKIYLAPLVLVFFAVNYKKTSAWVKSKKFWSINLFGVLLLFFLILPHLKSGAFFSRWSQVVKEKEQTPKTIFTAYINHFSPIFLFEKGEADFPGSIWIRHSIKGMGELYWFQLPFILVGATAFFLSKPWRKNIGFFILFLLLYPTGSIFTVITPSATHSIIGVVPFQVLTAIGILIFFEIFKKRRIVNLLYGVTLSLTIFFSFIRFLTFLKEYPLRSAGYDGWQYGFRQSVEALTKREAEFDDLLISYRFNGADELLKFYNVEYKCTKCGLVGDPIRVDTKRKQLFSIKEESIKEAETLHPNLTFRTEEIVYLPNRKPEFYVGYFVKE